MNRKEFIFPTVRRLVIALAFFVLAGFFIGRWGFGFPVGFYALGWPGLSAGFFHWRFFIVDAVVAYLIACLVTGPRKYYWILFVTAVAVFLFANWAGGRYQAHKLGELSQAMRDDPVGRTMIEQCEKNGGRWEGISCVRSEKRAP